MAAVASYADILKQVIREYAEIKPSYGDVQVETIFDDVQGHYELMYAGWHGSRRIHGSVIHADIRDGKVWIQHDGTEQGIADELVEAGIPKSTSCSPSILRTSARSRPSPLTDPRPRRALLTPLCHPLSARAAV